MIRGGIIVVGALATLVGLTVKSIYALFHLCSDLVFVILFPQLVGAVHIPFVNTYGSICAYVIGIILRVSGGEDLIGLKPWVKYPMYDYAKDKQYFPFRSLAMVISFIILVSVSYLANYLFDNGILDLKYDFLKIKQREEKREIANENADNLLLQERYRKDDNGAESGQANAPLC